MPYKNIDVEAIPAELKAIPQWVLWREDPQPDGKDGKPRKPNKVPVDPVTGRNTGHSEKYRDTWRPFAVAVDAYEKGDGVYAGIGLVITVETGLCAIDLDNIDCWPDPEAPYKVIDKANSYTEWSPSGNGFHILVWATKPTATPVKAMAVHEKNLELYDRHRFMTVTGHHVDGTPTTIEHRQALVEDYQNQMRPASSTPAPVAEPSPPSGPLPADDADLLEGLRRWRPSNHAFLTTGTGREDDDSANDWRACKILAELTHCDAVRIERLMRTATPLARDKWDKPYGDGRSWLQRTIDNAISEVIAKPAGALYNPTYRTRHKDTAVKRSSSPPLNEVHGDGLPTLPPESDAPLEADPGERVEHEPPEPVPEFTRERFPVEAFPDTLAKAIESMEQNIKIRPEMAGTAILGALALIGQATANVMHRQRPIPLSLNLLCLAISGDRKTEADRQALKVIHEWQEALEKTYQVEMKEYHGRLDAWKDTGKLISDQYKKEFKDTTPTDTDRKTHETNKAEHAKKEPTPPLRPRVLIREPTAEGTYRHLEHGRPWGGLFTTEGGAFFGGHGMSQEGKTRSITMYSDLWDGGVITRDRANADDHGQLYHRRLTVSIMLQPALAAAYLADEVLKHQGFMARFLICAPETLSGFRQLSDKEIEWEMCEAEGAAKVDPAMQRYWSHYRELLEMVPKVGEADDDTHGGVEPRLLTLTNDATRRWGQCFNDIETAQGPGGKYESIREAASKAGENIKRVSALFAVWEGVEQVSEDHVERADRIVCWYLDQMSTQAEETALEAGEQYMVKLLAYIRGRKAQRITVDELNATPRKDGRRLKRGELRGYLGELVLRGQLKQVDERCWEYVTGS